MKSWHWNLIQIARIKRAKTTALLYKGKELLDDKTLYILYIVLIVPHLIYCIEVWWKPCKAITNPIFILLKTAVIIISIKCYSHQIVNKYMFSQLKLLKFHDLIDYSVLQCIKLIKMLISIIQLKFVKGEIQWRFLLNLHCEPVWRCDVLEYCNSRHRFVE